VAYITTLLRERPQLAVGGALAAMVLWNVSLMAVAAGGAYRIGEAISFGDVGARQVRVLHRWFGHPFSYPANLAYAASNRVAPWRYDLLRPYRFLADPGRPYGRVDVGSADAPYVLDGWHDAEHDGAVTFRWADRTAMLLVPLAYPAALLVQVQAHAFSFPGAPPQRVTISINGARLDPIVLGADWQRVEATAPASMWHSGVNRVLLDFEWAARPAALPRVFAKPACARATKLSSGARTGPNGSWRSGAACSAASSSSRSITARRPSFWRASAASCRQS